MTRIYKDREEKRGCGFRKPGGLYFVCDGPATICPALPIELNVCPCCGQGVEFFRGLKKINAMEFLKPKEKCFKLCDLNERCGLMGEFNRENYYHYLQWIGERFYKRTHDFINESKRQGISRRIKSVPREFKVGSSWVFLAHLRSETTGPAIFSMFCPERIEYIVRGDETESQLSEMEKRGLTLIFIKNNPEPPIIADKNQISLL